MSANYGGKIDFYQQAKLKKGSAIVTDSIYNNAGMPSEQGAALTMPEDLRRELAHLNFLIEESCTGQATSMTRSWADRIAALTLERDTLKAEVERLSAPVSDEEFTQAMRKCVLQNVGWHGVATQVIAARASAPPTTNPISDDGPDECEGCDKPLRDDEGHETDDMVMLCDECWQGCADDPDCHSEECPCEACAAKIGTMKHPINDDEERRKDAGWNDRVKARCVCGEMIAWYSGEWLHVAGHSKSCADGRLASPAHFLVGMPPA